jgi:hypothetical protein
MTHQPNGLPKSGFALEIDGRMKTEFATKEGAEMGAAELKRRFPLLQVRIFDASAKYEARYRALTRLAARIPREKRVETLPA